MNYEKLDRKAIIAWRIGKIIGLLFLVATIVGVLIGIGNIDESEKIIKYFYIAAGLLLLYSLVGILVFPEIEYRQWRYILTEDKVELRHGIFFITTTVIPIIRVQHITVSRGPIYRKLGLSKVKIFLASGNFEIVGLTEERAEQISESLKSRVMERLDNKTVEVLPE